MSVREFLEEINIWFNRLSKEICPHQCGQALSVSNLNQSLRAARELKGEGRANRTLSSGTGTSIFSYPGTLELLIRGPSYSGLLQGPLSLRLLDLDWIIPLAFLILQLAYGRLWDFSVSITAWANSYNKSPLIYIYLYTNTDIYPIGSVSLENPNSYTRHYDLPNRANIFQLVLWFFFLGKRRSFSFSENVFSWIWCVVFFVFLFVCFIIYLFIIYLFWLHLVLVAVRRLFVAACRLLSCSLRTS